MNLTLRMVFRLLPREVLLTKFGGKSEARAGHRDAHRCYLRPVSIVVLLPCLAGSTVARLQHGLVSDVEFNPVELKAVAVNIGQIITNRFY